MKDQRFSDKEIARKSLPRLPSSDDDFDDDDAPTPKAMPSELPSLPPSDLPSSRPQDRPDSPSEITPVPSRSATISRESIRQRSESTSVVGGKDPSQLLSELRECFQRNEQALYSQLSKTPVATLNDVRRSFETGGRGAVQRLYAWERKHVPEKAKRKRKATDNIETIDPVWWETDCHVVPGSNVVVRETEWASIIALTLR